MKIEVLGSGCAKCKRLHKNVEKAVKKAGIDAEIIKIEDITEIMEREVMMTPGLIVDGQIVSRGKVASIDEIIEFIK